MSGWDERYAKDEYVYGTEPNRWLVAHASQIKPGGRVLCLGEGEGRNAVWLAGQGFSVEAVDASAVGLEKARRLAARQGVPLEAVVADLGVFEPTPGHYDAAVLIFVHLAPLVRLLVHARTVAALSPGGVVILEAFTHRQLSNTSGGPSQQEMLYEVGTLRRDFAGLEWEMLHEEDVELDEGLLHRGRAAVVHGVGRRVP